MRSARRGAGLVALAAITALVLTACGGGGGGSGAAVGDATGGAAKAGNDINPVDPAQLRQGGDFLWSLASLPPQFNRNQVDGTEADNADIMNAVMPIIFKGDAQGVLNPDPDYLESAEVTGTNPQVVTYRLNPKFAWNNGRAADWTDFEAQWKARNATNPAFLVAGTTGYTDIAGVAQGATPQEVVVTYAHNFADWRSTFVPLYPRETNADPQVFNEGWLNQPIVDQGAGPFMFDSIDRTAQRLTLVRNPKWWGRTPVLDRIIYVGLDYNAQPEAFANGSLSFLEIGPSVPFFQRAQQVPGAVIRKSNGPNYRHITFNGAPGSILEDPAVRKAIMKGIDRQIITQSQIGPIVPDARPLGNHLYVEGLAGYQDNSGVVAFNPDAARQELDAAGWTLQGDVRVKDGKQLTIRDVIPTGTPVSEAEARIVQQQLGQIGVQVTIDPVPLDNFFEQYVYTGNFDITHFAWLSTQTPVSSSSGIYRVANELGQNYGRIGNDTINQLLDQANQELDPAKQRDIVDQLDQEIWNAGHSLLLYQRPDAIAVQSNVANFGAFGFADEDYTAIGFTQ
ncbi:ABC transporter family substrate-binding protein [Pseudonocardia alaniniphila]|uniref:ABC transporter family substrate-binding protein n=1 Tax=Pseudonocardia alaniniphila TaxID=75291 RepID=A0ABS9T920_9PSEU|nr:ABC transporter family substrate-binding protein [Pseudonocardia alaniniphila]MCH6164918.1 ABC transporter family substrate-binding protein [Pseudonocardia alaniniphila]